MSHAATNWAIQQRGLKPATKIVLWHLCDRHNPDFGCFPTQVRLAEDAEMPVRAQGEAASPDCPAHWLCARTRSLGCFSNEI